MKYAVLILIIIGAGCQSTKEPQPRTIDEIIPSLDIENNLLFENPPMNIARKSVTRKDYECDEECFVKKEG